MARQQPVTHALEAATLADVLERVLDKGIVIAGDIRINLVDVELLTIQIRLVVCSVDKAIEMGMDWWANANHAVSQARSAPDQQELEAFRERLLRLEETVQGLQPGVLGGDR